MKQAVLVFLIFVTASPGAAGADKLDPGHQTRYDKLLEKLGSPCGKAQSLKTSLASDPSCRRNAFASKYVERLLLLDLEDNDIMTEYRARYGGKKESYAFDLSDTPSSPKTSSPVVLIEFFNYGCPHCAAFMPIMDQLLAAHGSDVTVYFKHFLLGETAGLDAAKGAWAARKQGKWNEMHHKLLSNYQKIARDDVFRYAKELGLDMQRFAADFEDSKTLAHVKAETEEGKKAELEGTPQIYLDGVKYDGMLTPDDLADWIGEEKAVKTAHP